MTVAAADSAVEQAPPWLRHVPPHWSVRRLKTALARNDGGVWGEQVSEGGTVVLRSTEQTVDGKWQIVEPARCVLSPADKAAALLATGDLVVTKSSGSELHIGKTTLVTDHVAQMDCCFSNFMQRLRPRPDHCPDFIYYILNNAVGRDQLVYLSNTTTGLANLNGSMIGNIVAAFPPLPEQRAIATFLDRKTTEIDEVISKKKRQIHLLHEKREALISHAVTRGTDLSATRAPANWKVGRLKFQLQGISQGWSPQCENRQAEPGEWGVLKVGCMNTASYDESENKALPADLQPVPELEVRVGDVLMSRSNTLELVGSVGMVHETQGRIMLCDKLYRLRINRHKVMPQYAVYLSGHTSHASRSSGMPAGLVPR